MLGFCSLSVAADHPYLQELIQRARENRLPERPEWHALLHYQPRTLGLGVKSLVDAESFFAAPNGKIDPEAELDATLASFFSSFNDDGDREHPQCVFMARYVWLKQELDFDGRRLVERKCSRFARWFTELDPRQLTLVFASAYLNNPASMFGHTLLRVDAQGQDEATRLLAKAVNFAANANEEPGVAFAINGVFGGYPGRFSIAPYHRKVKEYGDIENRDIWEYRLNFTPEEIERLLRHLWELRSAYFDYYFFDENCSYQLLPLLEVARPSLSLSGQFRWWAVPTDTVWAITETPGLLQGVTYRPARSTILLERLRLMEGNLPKLAEQLAAEELEPNAASVAALPTKERAQVLELAVDHVAYRTASRPELLDRADRLSHELLKARNEIDVPDQTPLIPAPRARPDQGHKSARMGFGYGFEEPKQFLQYEVRPAYHDLLDAEGGYTRGVQVQFLDLALRLYPEDSEVKLERLNAIDVVSLSPWNHSLTPISWKVTLGATRRRFDDLKRSLVGRLNPGVGLSYDLAGSALVYAFAEGSAELSDRFDQVMAVGVGPSFGVIIDISDLWRLGLSGRSLRYFLGEHADMQETTLRQQVRVTDQSALRLDLSWQREIGASFLGAHASLLVYF